MSDNSISDGAFLSELLAGSVLRTLDLENNSLRELPANLQSLHIPPEFESKQMRGGSLPQSINLFGNPLKTPPLELIERGHPAVMAWFRALADKDGVQ